ncbi:MAG: hypothetical protein QM658_15370 [Gordonia sp. (in: high G+C Gram-positive bacteria)]
MTVCASYLRDDDNGYEAVVFERADSGSTLAVMTGLGEPTEDDIASGTAGHCVVVDDAATFYDGVERVGRDTYALAVEFSAEACAVLGTPATVDIPLPEPTLTQIYDHLRRITARRG